MFLLNFIYKIILVWWLALFPHIKVVVSHPGRTLLCGVYVFSMKKHAASVSQGHSCKNRFLILRVSFPD